MKRKELLEKISTLKVGEMCNVVTEHKFEDEEYTLNWEVYRVKENLYLAECDDNGIDWEVNETPEKMVKSIFQETYIKFD